MQHKWTTSGPLIECQWCGIAVTKPTLERMRRDWSLPSCSRSKKPVAPAKPKRPYHRSHV